MGLQQSYLSERIKGEKQYNTDMVTVVSEKALNSQMRRYLSVCNWKTRVYFLKTIEDNGDVVLFMLTKGTDETKIPAVFELSEKVKTLSAKKSSIFDELEKLNLFSIPNGRKSTDEPAIDTALKEYQLGFAFHLEDGIPKEMLDYLDKNIVRINPDDFLKIITIESAINSVKFKQFFRNIKIIQMNLQIVRSRVIATLSSTEQKCDPNNPFQGLLYATCTIGIDLRSESHKEITDPAIKKKIESMAFNQNPDTVFDISQITLDLSTLQTATPISIGEINTDIKTAYINLINEYFSRLEKAGQTVFGHIVLPKPNNTINYLFRPNARNFAVTDGAIYYLINFNDNKSPIIPNLGANKDFRWKPLLGGAAAADGAMAISATKFLPIIRASFEPVLQYFAIEKYPYVDVGTYKYNIKWRDCIINTKQNLAVNVDEPWKANWRFQKQSNQDYQCLWAPPTPFPLASAKIDSDYQASCETALGTVSVGGITYPSYDFILRVRGWLNFGYNSKGNSGWYYDHTIRFQIVIKVDTDGAFKFVQKVTDTDNKPGGVSINGWGSFCSFGTLDNVVRELTMNLNSVINRAKDRSIIEFTKNTNTFAGWFLPGCRTFAYKNEGISNYGDFYTYSDYIQ